MLASRSRTAAAAVLGGYGLTGVYLLSELLFPPFVRIEGVYGASLAMAGASACAFLTGSLSGAVAATAVGQGRVDSSTFRAWAGVLLGGAVGAFFSAVAAYSMMRASPTPFFIYAALVMSFAFVTIFMWLGGHWLCPEPSVNDRTSRRWALLAAVLLLPGYGAVGAMFVLQRALAPRFPKTASIVERDAWMRQQLGERVAAEYGKIADSIKSSPQIAADIGAVTAVAPSARRRITILFDMNDTDYDMALDVVGEKGRGVYWTAAKRWESKSR